MAWYIACKQCTHVPLFEHVDTTPLGLPFPTLGIESVATGQELVLGVRSGRLGRSRWKAKPMVVRQPLLASGRATATEGCWSCWSCAVDWWILSRAMSPVAHASQGAIMTAWRLDGRPRAAARRLASDGLLVKEGLFDPAGAPGIHWLSF